jgi:hypothetical protein
MGLELTYIRNATECLLVLWNNPPYEDSGTEIASQDLSPTSFVIPQEAIPDLSKPERITNTTITIPTQDVVTCVGA